jgi:toxin ParE1/3/4
MRSRFHPEAKKELEKSFEFYFSRSHILAEHFLSEVESSIESILRNPEAYPQKNNIRRFQLRKFPFTIFYALDNEEIYILALSHQKREPEYWSERK